MVQPFDSKMIISETFPTAWKQTFLDKSIDSFDSCRIVNIIQHMNQLATKAAYNDQKNKRKKKNKQNNGQRGVRGWKSQRNRDRTDNGGTFGGRGIGGRGRGRGGYNHNNNGGVATTTEAEVAEATTMYIRTTSIRGTNNTSSRISSNKCLRRFHCLIQQAVPYLTLKTTTWTATRITQETILTVANGATKGNAGPDKPDLVQRALS